ncbi:MAG TPA: hypothetical protein VMY98_00195 [Anaerolineae bacterium]|nr:hypothetical protein [Anaerolineae bacterium]
MTRTTIEVMAALCAVTQSLPIGTNLALLQFLWMLLSGQLLSSRGALFPGLKGIGLSTAAVRRAWAAFRYGAWHIASLLTLWQQYVTEQPHWQALQYEGYVPIAVDITPYWRPALEGCASKHYHPQAGKALQAVEFGLIGRVGQVNGQRVTLLTDVLRGDLTDASSASLAARLLKRVATTLAADEMTVLDAGFKVKAVQAAGISRFVVRGSKNFAARRNRLPPYAGRGRKPEYGALVRPLARKRKGRTIAATPPDRVETWQADGLTLRAKYWYDLVATDTKVDPDNAVFHVAVIHDPRFKGPWVLISPLKLSGHTLWRLYQARWPIEQVPLVAKQTLGGARQFVHAPESCRRLPELTLLASTMLTYLAATLPPTPTGFWDRNPKPTAGRLRRVLAGTPFPNTYPLPGRLREKASVTSHLPKGILGHRRQKRPKVA